METPMKLKSFRDLRIWQLAMELVEVVYKVTKQFPKEELYGLAVSIPSNIAEGHTREHTKEFLHHLSMAQASLAELDTQLGLSQRLNYLSEETLTQLSQHMVSLGKQQYALRNALLRRLDR